LFLQSQTGRLSRTSFTPESFMSDRRPNHALQRL
jgi:hypothetical protein